jgi:hypothetical protein
MHKDQKVVLEKLDQVTNKIPAKFKAAKDFNKKKKDKCDECFPGHSLIGTERLRLDTIDRQIYFGNSKFDLIGGGENS